MKKALHSLESAVDRFMKTVASDGGDLPAYLETLSVLYPVLAAIERLEGRGLPRSEILPCLAPVREALRQSPLFRRMQDWPRGYQGDFEMVEHIVSGNNLAPEKTVAYHLEQYGLRSSAVQQHRNKIFCQAELIMRTTQKMNSPAILSVACGGSPDLFHIQDFLNGAPIFTLYDNDEEALEYSRSRLSALRENCNFIRGNVLRIARNLRDVGAFDLVIMGGVFDYLRDGMIINILRTLWENLLNVRGTLFFSNMSHDNPSRILTEYLADWFLIMRDEEEIMRLCASAGIPESSVSFSREMTRCAIMAEVEKS